MLGWIYQKNLENFQKVFNYIKNGIIKNIIDDLKEKG